jgi:hypothetical protein
MVHNVGSVRAYSTSPGCALSLAVLDFATEAAHERVGVAVFREAVDVAQVPAVHD